MSSAKKPSLLDPVIHETSRLMLVSVLNACGSADFNFLLASTDLSRGNFSTHMSRLLASNYVEEDKHFVGRRPHTVYRLTRVGRAALKRYRKAWESVVSGDAFPEMPEASGKAKPAASK